MKVIKFEAQWCNPCKMMKPEWDMVKKVFSDVDFEICDINDNSKLAQAYGVMSIPTLVFIKDGNEVERIIGFTKSDKIIDIINKFK